MDQVGPRSTGGNLTTTLHSSTRDTTVFRRGIFACHPINLSKSDGGLLQL